MTPAWRTSARCGHMSRRTWSKDQLIEAVKISLSVRQVLGHLKVVGAGGNYATINKYLRLYRVDTSHFTGAGWRKGSSVPVTAPIPLAQCLVRDSEYGSHKLKKRLFSAGLKPRHCEECGWAKRATDGRLPLELDHINGNRTDNRLENLRILCPNCHSLRPTHRGRNKGRYARMAERDTQGA